MKQSLLSEREREREVADEYNYLIGNNNSGSEQWQPKSFYTTITG